MSECKHNNAKEKSINGMVEICCDDCGFKKIIPQETYNSIRKESVHKFRVGFNPYKGVSMTCPEDMKFTERGAERVLQKTGRNSPCICGSSKKFKYCCLKKEKGEYCETCGVFVKGLEYKMCCSAFDCGCMGLPQYPCVCSEECYDKGLNEHLVDKCKHNYKYSILSLYDEERLSRECSKCGDCEDFEFNYKNNEEFQKLAEKIFNEQEGEG